MAKAVKQLIKRIEGRITIAGEIKSPVVIVYHDELIQLENRISELESELEDRRGECRAMGAIAKELEDERDALMRWQNKAIDIYLMWMENKDEIDFTTHIDRLLRELCNCENELPPCSMCYRIAKVTRKEIGE